MMWNVVLARNEKKLKLLRSAGLTLTFRLSVCVLHPVFYPFINCIFVTFWSSLVPVLTSSGTNFGNKAFSSIIERFKVNCCCCYVVVVADRWLRPTVKDKIRNTEPVKWRFLRWYLHTTTTVLGFVLFF